MSLKKMLAGGQQQMVPQELEEDRLLQHLQSGGFRAHQHLSLMLKIETVWTRKLCNQISSEEER